MDDKQIKEAMKEALKEWIEDKYTQFGKFSFWTLGALFLAGIVYFILRTHGWHP